MVFFISSNISIQGFAFYKSSSYYLIIGFIPALEEITSSFYHVNLIQLISQQLYKSGKFSYISKFHIIISCKLIVYIVMCFYQETN